VIKQDIYAQNIKILRQACIEVDSIEVCYGVFAKSSCEKIRIVLFPRITDRSVMGFIKVN
jgi:hypothetical protein